MPDSTITKQLASLPGFTKPRLYELWRRLFKKDPPSDLRRDLLQRIVARRLQEQEFGGLSESGSRQLRQWASTFDDDPKAAVSKRPPIKSGTRLLRQWRDQVHVVNVTGDEFEYRGARYESLSEIARLITGTRWSGPLFFGVKNKQSTSMEVQ
jgi:Protein of unknown function (DUF2924)